MCRDSCTNSFFIGSVQKKTNQINARTAQLQEKTAIRLPKDPLGIKTIGHIRRVGRAFLGPTMLNILIKNMMVEIKSSLTLSLAVMAYYSVVQAFLSSCTPRMMSSIFNLLKPNCIMGVELGCCRKYGLVG